MNVKSSERKVKFGLAFQASQPFSYYQKCAELAIKYGFDMFQVYDDLLFKPAWPILFSIATYASESKKSLVIGPGVVNPFHTHPSLIATNLACLQEESRGNSFLMIGRGAFHDLFELDTPKPISAVREAIEIIDNIVSGKSFDYNGKVFSARSEATLRWIPQNRSAPQMWIGTWGPRMCELAGSMKQVSGVMVSSITDPEYIRLLKTNVEIGARRAKRDPREVEVGCVPGTIISKDRDKALELARKASAVYIPYLEPMASFVGVTKEEISSVRNALAKRDLELAASLVSDKSVDSFKLWGTPDDIIEKTMRLVDNGGAVDRINFGFGRGQEDYEAITLLGEKILPYFDSISS